MPNGAAVFAMKASELDYFPSHVPNICPQTYLDPYRQKLAEIP